MLTFVSAPDYETKSSYTATVTASDGVNETTQDITVNITNLNDNAPQLTSAALFGSVDENQTAIGTVTATDADGDAVTFTISGTELDITSAGVLTFVSAPDYETKSSYTATVTASDGVYSTTQDITIGLTNLNDNNPGFTSDSAFSAAENQTAIGTVTASDADGDAVTFTISGTELEITSAGVLTFASAPDYETKSSYTATVTASDGVNETTQDITITIINLIEITAEENINIDENTQTADYSITDAGGSSVNLEIIRDYGKDFTPTNTIGNSDGTNFVLNDPVVINDGEIYQALSDIQVSDGASITIKAGGKLISRYVEVDGSYSRPAFSTGTTFSNTYGEGVVLVSNDGTNYEEANSVGNQNILLFDGSSFKVEGTKDNPAEIRNISIAFATKETSDNASINIDYVNWRGGSLHPFFFYRTNAQSSYIRGSLKLTNSYLSFVNSVNLMRLDRRGLSEDIVIEDNVFHNSGGFSLDFNYQTSGLLRIQRNLYFGEDVYRSNKPAFLSIGITGGTSQQYPKHTDDRTKVLFKDNAILATPDSSKAIYCENYDAYVPWEGNYFGYRADFDNTVRKTITDKNSDLSKTCSYPNSLILLESPRTWDVRPDFYFTEDNKIIMDVPVDYESATNKVIPFNIKATNSNDESKILDMQMTVIDVDEPAEPIISEILDQISVQENTVFVSNFTVQSDSTDTVTMSLSGDDADKFEVSSNNLLAFITATNFEAPTDTDTNNIYKVTLTASTAVTSTSIDIEVTVENQQEEANQPTLSDITWSIPDRSEGNSVSDVDVSTSSKDITFTLRVQDESGVEFSRSNGSLYLYSNNGLSINTDSNHPGWTLKSGDNKDGIWETTITVPQGQTAGSYFFNSGAFIDPNGLYRSCSTAYANTSNENSCGAYHFFAVDNGLEANQPTLSDITWSIPDRSEGNSVSDVDVSTSSKDITFTLRVQDESGVEFSRSNGSLYLYSNNGLSINTDSNHPGWTLKSGDNKDGIWETTITVPQGQTAGSYFFNSGAFIDPNGLYRSCSTAYANTSNENSCGAYHFFAVDSSGSSTVTYYLYGGIDQSDYLGSYGGFNSATDSICNSAGTYGSNVSTSSIWNTVGSYGSTVGTYSPWNSVSTSPPEFFNQDKTTTYGKFTINTVTANRTTVTKLTNIIDYFNNNSSDIAATREYACEQTQSAAPTNSLSSDKPNLNLSNKVIFD